MAGQVRVSHILLMYEGSERSTATRSKEAALAEIGDIKGKITEGEDFAALAGAHSDCPSGRDGGDLGFFSPGAMVPEFDAVAFDLEIGADSDVVTTAFGYHLLRRTG
jgi:parvulin-like peptidyl-prolyl isomerase